MKRQRFVDSIKEKWYQHIYEKYNIMIKLYGAGKFQKARYMYLHGQISLVCRNSDNKLRYTPKAK